MSVVETLERLGGFADARELRKHHSRKAIRHAVGNGTIVRPARGRYAVPQVRTHPAIAHAHQAVLSHLSAALEHGWKIKLAPTRPWLLVTAGRPIPTSLRASAAHVGRAHLTEAERAAGVTAPLRTVIDCARALPFDEALAVADSAVRSGMVSQAELQAAGLTARGPGASRVRRVCAAADGRAANPFESVVRAITMDIPGLDLAPQQTIAEPGLYAIVDLLDRARRLVIEADGYEHHGTRAGFVRDARRYTEMGAYGYRVLRFVWIDVMQHPEWVRWVLLPWLATEDGRPLPAIPDDSPYLRDRAS